MHPINNSKLGTQFKTNIEEQHQEKQQLTEGLSVEFPVTWNLKLVWVCFSVILTDNIIIMLWFVWKRVVVLRSVIPVVYIKTTVDQRSGKWQSKNTTIFVGTIIYQLHVSAVIGHLQVGIQCQRKNIYYKYRYGGTRSRLQNVCFINITRLAEWVGLAQNVCFISTTDSFQNIFRSNKYVYWHYFIWQLSWLTSHWLASFIKPRRAINNVSVGNHNLLQAEDKHFQQLFWKRGVTGIISNGSAYRPISWTLC